MANELFVRSLQLQAALTEFVAQAADSLHEDVRSGEEVPFELASQSGRRRGAASLYSYRPLTGPFIAERFVKLRELDAYAKAAASLNDFDALDRYLIASGADVVARSMPRKLTRVDAGLLALLQDVFDQQTDFDRAKVGQYDERLERALERLESSTFAAAGEVSLVATLHGLTIASPELALARGLLIAQPQALADAPDQVLRGPRGEDDHLIVVFTSEDGDPRGAIAHGTEVIKELLRALRLFGDGRIALGPLAWERVGSAPWSPIALGTSGRPHGMLMVSAEQEDELRAFCNLISRRAPHANRIAWALRRFELGCERASEYEGLSDHILALRALLGAPSQLEATNTPDGVLAGRLAALCATSEHRSTLSERTLRTIALERQAIAGTAVERTSGITLARELSDHLRALLRDVVCGHLSADLASLADRLLLSDEDLAEQSACAPVATRSGEEAFGDQRESSEILHLAV